MEPEATPTTGPGMRARFRDTIRPSTLALLALTACQPGDRGEPAVPASATEPAYERVMAAAAAPALGWEDLVARLEARIDSVDRALRRVPNLTGAEQGALRRDVNAVQTATAQRMGIRRGSDPEELVARGRLLRLPDSTAYWVVRELDYSAPYVTRDTEAMLHEIGERFHAQLDSLGLPRYRFEITSVLRTPQHQARLRRTNPNAASGVSAHEFGTTVDIAYRRFAPPAGAADDLVALAPPALREQVRVLHDSLVVENARLRGTELQAVLGRVMREMRGEGKLQVMMERQQTVYHTTVARTFPEREPVPASAAHSGARLAATGAGGTESR